MVKFSDLLNQIIFWYGQNKTNIWPHFLNFKQNFSKIEFFGRYFFEKVLERTEKVWTMNNSSFSKNNNITNIQLLTVNPSTHKTHTHASSKKSDSPQKTYRPLTTFLWWPCTTSVPTNQNPVKLAQSMCVCVCVWCRL